MPAAVKLRACREVSSDFVSLLDARLHSGGSTPVDAFRAAARDTGIRAGERLRGELRLRTSLADAELAWRLVSNASGMRYIVERRPGKSLFHHVHCPVFAAGGAALCRDFCLPMVEGLTAAICPSCSVEIVEPAGPEGPCVKALVLRESSNA